MNRKGASAVWGVVLMVAVTVVIAGAIYWFVSNYEVPKKTDATYDLNGDGVVNQTDAKILESHYRETGEPGWIPSDINKDGIVDYLDVSALVSHMT
jgi:flagellin-like protein